jgi:hypothetical protein
MCFGIHSSRWKLGQRCGFVLVGHCFGGLIIKSLAEEANKRAYSKVKNEIDEQSRRSANKFLKNLQGIVFYAVPHAGSELESYFKRCSSNWSDKIFGVKLARFMENLKSHQSRMENLSNTFDSIMKELHVNVFAFMEGIPTKDVVSSEYYTSEYLHPCSCKLSELCTTLLTVDGLGNYAKFLVSCFRYTFMFWRWM